MAREADYSAITLWTMSILHSARRLYESAGFELIEETPYDNFGPALMSQRWRLSF